MSNNPLERIDNQVLRDIVAGDAVMPDDPVESAARVLRDRGMNHIPEWVGKTAAHAVYITWKRGRRRK